MRVFGWTALALIFSSSFSVAATKTPQKATGSRGQTKAVVSTPAPAAQAAPAPKQAEPVAKPAETETIESDASTEGMATPQGDGKVGAKKGAPKSDEGNAAFAYTHSLPSPVNMPGGTYVIGTTVAVGVFDFLQFSTNTFRLFTRAWNVQAKVSLIEYPTFIVSAFLDYESINLNHHDDRNPDLRVNSWQPGLVTGYEINEDMAFFLGGNFHSSAQTLPATFYKSGFFQGARVNFDWSWMYNPVDSRLANNAIAAGTVYDLTYKTIGFGVTHHWPSFQLGIHYTANVDNHRVLPIFNIASGFSF